MESIWPGSGSSPINNTPFGLYDDDPDFQDDPLSLVALKD